MSPRSRRTSTGRRRPTRGRTARRDPRSPEAWRPVRHDEAKVSMARNRAVEHEVHNRARRVEEELQHRPWTPERRVLPADRRRRVDQHRARAGRARGRPDPRPDRRGRCPRCWSARRTRRRRDDRCSTRSRRSRRRHPEVATIPVGRTDREGRRPRAGRLRSPRRPGRPRGCVRARWTPGVEIDRSDVAIPRRSISATCSGADHAGICGMPSG